MTRPLHNASLTARKSVREDIGIITLSFNNPFTWQPGQYVMLHVPGFEPRPYSIAAGYAAANSIDIHVKDATGSGLSRHLLDVQAVPSAVQVSGPHGEVMLQDSLQEPILMIAGGMGITPLLAILNHALSIAPERELALYWGGKTDEDLYMRAYFEELAATHPHFTFRAVTGTPVAQAAVDDFTDIAGYRIYLGGPPAMIDFTLPLLLGRGAREGHIFYDRPPVKEPQQNKEKQ